MASYHTRRNQLQWLGLLVVAVVLPTVSLLWFMSRVIANERLVVRQKLTALYGDKLAAGTEKTAAVLSHRLAGLDRVASAVNPYSFFRRLVLEDNVQGVVVWGADASVVYPRSADVTGSGVSSASPLTAAREEEFAKKQYAEAAKLYASLTSDADPHLAITASAGRSRCLARLGQIEEAVAECQKAAFATPGGPGDPALRLAIENSRLLLLSLLKQSAQRQPPDDSAHANLPKRAELFRRTVDALMDDLYNPAGERGFLPANQNLFIARKVIEALQGPYAYDNSRAKKQLEILVAAEALSIAAAESPRSFGSRPDAFFKCNPGLAAGSGGAEGTNTIYGLRHETRSSAILVLLSEAGLASILSGYHDAFAGTESTYRILDGAGDFVAGAPQPQGRPFTVAPLPEAFPGWKVELYFEGGDVFEKAANRQIAVYVWTGVLVILLILIAGVFATRAVSRQMRLNEMKNDFIATVSHELKTPLASMRLLVDTLLEGHVKDEAQGREYLRLTAKENERLSRMIDNFLTFSRMERNKKSFTLAEAAPGAMARDAAESVQTKFAAHGCQFALEIAEPVPDVLADHDAMVTVLVNLLDNACKYTTDDKKISLRIFADDGFVCFAVSDNGIGLARRQLRKVFDRFYQVDSSLTRKAEGCGLGLSIVKFIVDAHRGKISVESKPGQGSTFTVRLPVGRSADD